MEGLLVGFPTYIASSPTWKSLPRRLPTETQRKQRKHDARIRFVFSLCSQCLCGQFSWGSLLTKVGFISLGCPKHLVDSEVMMGLLSQDGFELTSQAGDAEVIVVNTCSFIAPAKRESINTILEMAE